MNRLEEIRKRMANYKEEYLPYFENNGQMQEWSQMFEDNQYLLNEVERLKVVLQLFADSTNWMGKNKMEYPDMGIVEWDGEVNPIKLAQEALKEPTPE